MIEIEFKLFEEKKRREGYTIFPPRVSHVSPINSTRYFEAHDKTLSHVPELVCLLLFRS